MHSFIKRSFVNIQLLVQLDRLRHGHIESIETILSPKVMQDVNDNDLLFQDPIHVAYEAYITDEVFILQLAIKTKVILTCGFCNKKFTTDIHIEQYTHEESVKDLRAHVFDASVVVREALLLEIPMYPLCGKTKCLQRTEIEPFLKKETVEEDRIEQEKIAQQNSPFFGLSFFDEDKS